MGGSRPQSDHLNLHYAGGNYGYPSTRPQNLPGMYQFPGTQSPAELSVQDSLAPGMLGKRRQQM